MDDQYKKYSAIAFIDSNVILECKPLANLPWHEILTNGSILILVVPQVLSEVDKKKQDNRVGKRARAFNQLLAQTLETEAPIEIVKGDLCVDIYVASIKKFDWTTYNDLNQSEGDDRIVAQIINSGDIDFNKVVAVSQDINFLFSCKNHGIQARRISDKWLPELGPTPQEIEVEKLKRELREIKKTEPEFEIKCVFPQTPIEIFKIKNLDEVSAQQTISHILECNPKPQQSMSDRLFSPLHQYDSSFDRVYEEYASKEVSQFVRSHHLRLETYFNQIPFTISVKNIGAIPANNIEIVIKIIDGWVNEKVLYMSGFPTAPRPKNKLHDLYRPPIIHTPTSKPILERDEFRINIGRCDESLIAQCEDFRHGKEWIFKGFCWLSPHKDTDTKILVNITASNMHGSKNEVISISKKILEKEIIDFIEPGMGEIRTNCHVEEFIEEAIRSQRYRDLDLIRGTEQTAQLK
ncbi:PIN domain-containing protein [Undibacterium umbellatum]|uniref:PIN domain-containing protein n=1 Tax=Undibacterium umbellatum TaxID=2762300 RepID=A0ABR6ZJ69_9BURK|nr:PIN domain-containing protein [Undibacterium umbellatum]MBC3911395.1 hypothetical protein [Undibacterium umbellatum]